MWTYKKLGLLYLGWSVTEGGLSNVDLQKKTTEIFLVGPVMMPKLDRD